MSPGQNGWRVNVFIPHRINPQDRVKVIQWLGDYRAEVRRSLPDVIVSFRQASPDHYFLEIKRAGWSSGTHRTQVEKLDNLWQQLAFDYA
jgi:hypothetical protein